MLNVLKGIIDNYLEVIFYLNYYFKKYKNILLVSTFVLIIFAIYQSNCFIQNKILLKNSSVQYSKYLKNNKNKEFLNNKQFGIYEQIRLQIESKKVSEKKLLTSLYDLNELLEKKQNSNACLYLYKNHSFNNIAIFSFAKNGKMYNTDIFWIKCYQLGYKEGN